MFVNPFEIVVRRNGTFINHSGPIAEWMFESGTNLNFQGCSDYIKQFNNPSSVW